MARKKHQKRRGHFCWCCGRYRPNERFSGSGHARRLCRECSRLGKKELQYRQALINMERCVSFDGHILRKRRKQFEPFLSHQDPRIRAAAEEIAAADRRCREEWCRLREEEALAEEAMFFEFDLPYINMILAEAAELDKAATDAESVF